MVPKTMFVFGLVSLVFTAIQAIDIGAGEQTCPAGDAECNNNRLPSIATIDVSLLQKKGQLKQGTESKAAQILESSSSEHSSDMNSIALVTESRDATHGTQSKNDEFGEYKEENNYDDFDGTPPYICLYRSIKGRGVLPGAMGTGKMMLKYIAQEASNSMGKLGKSIQKFLIAHSAAAGASIGGALGAAITQPFPPLMGVAASKGAMIGAALGPSIVKQIPGIGTAVHSYAVFDSKGKQISTLGAMPPTVTEASPYITRLQGPSPTEFKVWYRSNYWSRPVKFGTSGDWKKCTQYWGDNAGETGGTHAYAMTTADNKIVYTVGWSTPREDEMDHATVGPESVESELDPAVAAPGASAVVPALPSSALPAGIPESAESEMHPTVAAPGSSAGVPALPSSALPAGPPSTTDAGREEVSTTPSPTTEAPTATAASNQGVSTTPSPTTDAPTAMAASMCDDSCMTQNPMDCSLAQCGGCLPCRR